MNNLKKKPDNDTGLRKKAVSRWENEGGATKSGPEAACCHANADVPSNALRLRRLKLDGMAGLPKTARKSPTKG